MNDLILLVFMFISGLLLAAIYLGSLWLTVQRIDRLEHPGLWFVTSLIVRMLLLLVAFYFILGDGHWPRLLAALCGFITLRILVTNRVRRQLMTNHNDKEKPA